MKNSIVLIIFWCFLPLSLISQAPKDYILTMQRDTLFGKIKSNMDWESITFVHNKKKINFHASTIKYFGIFREGKYRRYKSIKDVDGVDLFVQILNEGKIKLYKAEEQYFRFSRFTYFNRVYYVGPSDDNLVMMDEEDYHNFINVIIRENPHLKKELKQLSFDELSKLVAMYNQL